MSTEQPVLIEGLPERTAAVEAPPVESKRRVRLKLVDRQQICLRATEPERLVEEDHPVRAIGDLWGRLDLSTADLI